MRAVDVCIHRREAVSKTFSDEALGREMVTLVKFVLTDDVEDARITLQARGVQVQQICKILNSRESSRRICERDSSDQAVNFIAKVEKMFRQIAAILAGDTGNQRFLRHHSTCLRRRMRRKGPQKKRPRASRVIGR